MVALTADVRTRPEPGPSRGLLALAALTVFGAILAGASFTWIQGVLLPIWFGSALVVYWFLCTPRRDWPAVAAVCWVALVAASVVLGRGTARSILLPAVNLIQALSVAAPLSVFRLDKDFTQPRTLMAFYVLVLGPSTMLSGLLAGFVLHWVAGAPVLQVWKEWYVTTALGLSMLVPILMVLRREPLAAIFAPKLLPGTLALLGIVAAAIAMNIYYHGYPLGFLFFPAVVLITFQRGFAGGALGLVLVVLYLVSGLHDVHRTLSASDVSLHLIFVQLYTAVISFTVVIVGAGLDQRRRLELNLAEAREEAVIARDAAEAASRAKTMFLANMSHELRTPLNAVIGFSNLMHREIYGPLGNGRYREYARSIHDAGHHLLEVIGDILDMSKIEAGKYEIDREDISLDALTRECVELMRERASERQLSVALELAGPERIVADRRAMKQIVLNLLSNAIKFTPAGGKVTVVTKTTSDRFVLAVVDTGVGIPAHELHRLGKPFVQLRRATTVSTQPGTGLGLALVRGIAESHGGVLIIDSEEGRGTSAKVEIPIIATTFEKSAA
jgi:signal transduction histidine kinase